MEGLLEKAAPQQQQQEGTAIEEQIDLATQVVRDTIYSDGAAESLFGVMDQAASVGAGMAKAVVMAVSPVVSAMHEKEPNLDPNIWFMEGGVLDNILMELAELLQQGGVEVTQEDIDEAREVAEQDATKMPAARVSEGT